MPFQLEAVVTACGSQLIKLSVKRCFGNRVSPDGEQRLSGKGSLVKCGLRMRHCSIGQDSQSMLS